MSKLFKQIIFSVVIISFFIPMAVFAEDYGLKETADVGGISTEYESDISILIGNLIGTVLSFISVMFLLLMLYSGIRWMLSRGNEEEAKKSLDTIIAAAIGLIIILSSYALTNLVFGGLITGESGANKADVVAKCSCFNQSCSGLNNFCANGAGMALKECTEITCASDNDCKNIGACDRPTEKPRTFVCNNNKCIDSTKK